MLGVPTSAAAHWPGLEKGPAALRGAAWPAGCDPPASRWSITGIGRFHAGPRTAPVNNPITCVQRSRSCATPGTRALAALGDHDQLVLHLDVDVLDALDLPLADIATYGTGLGLEHLVPLLAVVLADPRVGGMTVVGPIRTTTPTTANRRAGWSPR